MGRYAALNPHLTSRGLWVFGAALAFIGAGAVAQQALLLVMGEVMVAVLAVSFMLCVVAALALDRRFVEVSIRGDGDHPSYATSGLAVGRPVRVDVVVRNEAWLPLYGLALSAHGAEPLDFELAGAAVQLPSCAHQQRECRVTSSRIGRWALHGFDVAVVDPLGLLRARDYLPCTHGFECFPRLRGRRAGRPPVVGRAAAAPTTGSHQARRRGSGSSVRELRDYQSGDPLRHIAWKATARHRRLISREFDREVDQSIYLVLDISTSMRGGQWQGRKLDDSIDAVAEIAEAVASGGDRVGLMTFDEKVYGHIRPDGSATQLGRMMRHLTGLNSVVDPTLTEWSDDELVERVADYLLVQERLDFRRGDHVDAASGINTKLLGRWMRRVVETDRDRYDTAVLDDGVIGGRSSLVRYFAQLRGLSVPYRIEARLGLKEQGLSSAVDQIIAASRDSQSIVVVSDLCGVMNHEAVTRSIRLAQIDGHDVQFLVPFTPAYYDTDERHTQRYRISRELFAAREAEDRRDIADALRASGVSVDFMKPSQSALSVLATPT